MSEFVVIAGMSGAGRSTAADVMEDLGWFVIDNLPPALISKVAELAQRPGSDSGKIVLVIGHGVSFTELESELTALQTNGSTVRILFLDAAADVLVRRYDASRRPHPMEKQGVSMAIEHEREMLVPLKAAADIVIDTTTMNVHQLRDRIVEMFAPGDSATAMRTSIKSFGYKHGLPLDVDLVFDCRFLPNPHWEPDLRPLTGLDEPVRDYVLGQPETGAFLERLDDLLKLLLPAYVKEGKAYLTIAVGCTGGRHRSVAIAEEVAKRVANQGFAPSVSHRDIEK